MTDEMHERAVGGDRELGPPMMTGMLAGAESAGAKFVFMDNLYMYGPQTEPLREDLPLTTYGRKPATRAELTRMWREAHDAGRVEVAAVRASDFYGPGVGTAALGDLSFGRIAQGKAAQVIGDPLKVQVMPKPLMSVVGLFNGNVREMKEMLYQWERPFVVDHSKYADRFGDEATPLETGIAETAASYRRR